MKLACFSDLHLTNTSPYGDFSANGRSGFLDAKLRVAKRIIKHASELDGVLVVGDTIDARVVDAHTLQAASSLMASIDGLPFAILASGNHELDLRIEGGVTVVDHYRLLKHNDGFHIITQQAIIRYKDVEFFILPHIPDLETTFADRVSSYLRDSEAKVKVLLLHYGITGASFGTITSKAGINDRDIKKAAKRFDFIVCGDYHKSQYIAGLNNVFYCGSPMVKDFGELDSEHGYWVIDTDSGEVEFFDLAKYAPKFIEVVCPDIGTVDAHIARLARQRHKRGSVVRFVVCTKPDESVNVADIRSEILGKCEGLMPMKLLVKATTERRQSELADVGEVGEESFIDTAIARYVNARVGDKDKRRLLKKCGLEYVGQ